MAERGPSLMAPRPRPRRAAERARDAERVLAGVTELPALGPPGRPLSQVLQRELSARLGRDLSGVRLHHDEFAADLADALDAEAVAHGDDVYFGAAAADVGMPAGRALLVHELVHGVHGALVPGAAPRHHEEAAAEITARDAWTAIPPRYATAEPSPQPARPAGRLARLARRALRTLPRRDDPETPDVVSAGEALVRLVDRLLSRDPADLGGRLRAVLTRLDAPLREAVVTTVAERRGGSAKTDLAALVHERAPEDGGRNDAEPTGDDAAATGREAAHPGEATRTAGGEAGAADATAGAAGDATIMASDEAARADATAGARDGAAPTDPTAAAGGEAARAAGADGGEAADGSGRAADALPEGDEEVNELPPAPAALSVPAGELPEGAAAGAPAAPAPPAPAAAGAADVPAAGEAPAAEAKPLEAQPEAAAAGAGEAAAETDSGEAGPASADADQRPPGEGVDTASAPSAGDEQGVAAAVAGEAEGATSAGEASAETTGVDVEEAARAGEASAETPGVEAEGATPAAELSAEPAAGAAAAEGEAAPRETATTAGGGEPETAASSAESEAAATAAAPSRGEGAGAGDGRAESKEPEDPPEITQPPAPEDDAQPSLPDPPVPVEEPQPQPPGGAESMPDEPPESAVAQAAEAAVAQAGEPAMAAGEGVGGTPSAGAQIGKPAPGASGVAGPLSGVPGSERSTAGPMATEATGVGAGPPAEAMSVEVAGGAAGPVPAMAPAGDGPEPVLADPPAPSGGGGGGGAAIPDPPAPVAPDVSGMEPQAALGAVSSLPATALAGSLSGVSAAAQGTVKTAQDDLAANPPSMERPSGVPADKDASLPPAPLPPLLPTPDRTVPDVPGGPGADPPQPAAPPAPGAPVTARVPEARVGGETQISREDASRIQGAVKGLPTTDPALDADAGPVPALELAGGEDPQRVGEKAQAVEDTTAGAQTDGLTDARADMGENDVLPQVPKETLTADVSGGDAAPAAPAAPAAAAPAAAAPPAGEGPGEVPPAAIDAIAAEQGSEQIDASTQEQGTALGSARDEHETSVTEAKADTDRQINDEIAADGEEQTSARRDIRVGVGRDRRDWVGEQDKLAGQARTAADAAKTTADTSIGGARQSASTDAGKAIRDGNSDIARERADAERKAREEREKGEKESEDGGFFSWLGSKVKSFFNAIKNAIHKVFDLARKAVDAVISAAQKLAVAAIELGRRAVVAAIELGGKALELAGDIVLAGFPEARERFHKKIRAGVDAAKQKVNEIADKLKAGVTKLLDALGKALKGALTLLEKAYTAAIDAVAKVVDTVIKAAKAIVDALLDFAALIVDIASSPRQWLKNLGSGLVEGAKHHVWPALVTAVKDWFKAKVEEVIGVGKLILDVLKRGGITFGKIVTMAWEAIKEALPGILIQLLIEKLVAMLIPAGGAISLIIDGLKAAWAAASRILAAFKRFMAFLKAVKPGEAAPKFGDLVAAVAVAVLDFLANFLIGKLKGAGTKVGGTLKKMAGRFMKVVKKVAGVVKRGAKAAAGAVKRTVIAAGQALKKGGKAVINAVKKVVPKGVLKAGAKAVKYVATKAKAAVAKVKATYKKAKEKLFGKKKPKPKETKEQKLQRAIDRTRATVTNLLNKGVSRPRLWATLQWLKMRWRWQRLERTAQGEHQFTVEGVINPPVNIGTGTSTVTILHSGGPVLVGGVPASQPAPGLAPVTVGTPGGGRLDQQYASAVMTQRLQDIAQTDIGRQVEIPMPGRTVERQGDTGSVFVRERRKAGGESSLSVARVNPEMAIRKGDPAGPFVRPDARTGLVPGVDPATGKHDPSRDSVHLYEITTMTSFVDGSPTMAKHKQQQALWTINNVLRAFPGAKVHYTFISQGEADDATKRLIQQIVTGLPTADQARFTVKWIAIGWTR